MQKSALDTARDLCYTYHQPSPPSAAKYVWSQPSATCFQTSNPGLPSNQLVPLSPADLTGPASGKSTSVAALNFYDRAQEDLTVACAVTMTAPDGKTVLNVTAKSPPINVLKPTVTHWDIAEGYVQPNRTANGAVYGLYGDLANANITKTNGMIWNNVMASVPPPFTGNGQCTFTQMVIPNRLLYVGNSSKPYVPNNGILGLDGAFDYGNRWSVTMAGGDVDSPNQPFGYTGLTEISAFDAFTTYVMYQPPGGVWVPLKSYDWSWSFTSKWDKNNNQWTLFRANPPFATSDPHYTGIDTPKPPQWSLVQNNT